MFAKQHVLKFPKKKPEHIRLDNIKKNLLKKTAAV
jgi:hypothetical protein